eukprot:CAMPEP_0195281356 /NCGR_PEP_ID=MMETSP0707-20130614/704_1 /TAXON_ID=33640 /ORGANISM="Asterionellopsis glacialis, Strain CCMP134" /LENGTH=324 /DNA_ID=CAMNT_0040340237 /DNA_START=47 /DNA_END=1018 /DNA_ORIENTATION=-
MEEHNKKSLPSPAVGSNTQSETSLRPDQVVSDRRRSNAMFAGFAENNLHNPSRGPAMVNNQAFFGMPGSNLPYPTPPGTFGPRSLAAARATRPDSSGTVPGWSFPGPQIDPVFAVENNFFRKPPSFAFPRPREASAYLARQNYLTQRGDFTGSVHMNHPSFFAQPQNIRIPSNQNMNSQLQHNQKMINGNVAQDIAKPAEGQEKEASKKKRSTTGRPAQDEAWYAMFERLLQFKAETGHCIVPVRYKKDIQLGAWVRNQRIRKASSSKERVRLLDSIGFNWSVKEQREQHLWRTMFTRLLAFRDKHGHCKVPQRYRDDPQLGTW